MIDFIIDVSDICWGIVGEVHEDHFTVPTNEWAPGIWAGSEFGWIQIKDPQTKIVKAEYMIWLVDLQDREVWTFTKLDNIKTGDLIYPKVNNGR